MDGMLTDMINQIGSNMFAKIAGPDGILTKDPFTAYGSGVSSMITNLYNAVMSVSMMLVFIYFLIAIVDKMTSENFTWDQVFKQMAMLLAAKVVIEHGLEIMQLMSKIGVEMVNIVGAGGISYEPLLDASEIISNFDAGKTGIYKILSHLILFCYLIFPWIFSWIMGMAVKIICYSRLIEIYVRASFAPIALSDFFKNGFQGGGWRFLKSFLAVCLQGAVILVIGSLFTKLIAGFLNGESASVNLFQFLGVYFAAGCAAIMLMFRSLGLCKEMLGVGN